MRNRPASVPVAVRSLVVAATLVLPATGVGSLLHFSLVDHAVCPEHGEVTHVDGHAHALDGGAPEDSFTTGSGPARGTHHHCTMASVMREQSVSLPPGPEVAAVPVSIFIFSALVSPAESVAILRFAPKSSPPA